MKRRAQASPSAALPGGAQRLSVRHGAAKRTGLVCERGTIRPTRTEDLCRQ